MGGERAGVTRIAGVVLSFALVAAGCGGTNGQTDVADSDSDSSAADDLSTAEDPQAGPTVGEVQANWDAVVGEGTVLGIDGVRDESNALGDYKVVRFGVEMPNKALWDCGGSFQLGLRDQWEMFERDCVETRPPDLTSFTPPDPQRLHEIGCGEYLKFAPDEECSLEVTDISQDDAYFESLLVVIAAVTKSDWGAITGAAFGPGTCDYEFRFQWVSGTWDLHSDNLVDDLSRCTSVQEAKAAPPGKETEWALADGNWNATYNVVEARQLQEQVGNVQEREWTVTYKCVDPPCEVGWKSVVPDDINNSAPWDFEFVDDRYTYSYEVSTTCEGAVHREVVSGVPFVRAFTYSFWVTESEVIDGEETATALEGQIILDERLVNEDEDCREPAFLRIEVSATRAQ